MDTEFHTFVLNRNDLDQIMHNEEDKQPITINNNKTPSQWSTCFESFCQKHINNEEMDDSATDEPTNSENDFSSFAYISSKLSKGPKTLDNTFI